MTEAEIRNLVHDVVSTGSGNGASRTVDEFVVSDLGRIDLAVIGDHLVGYEFKSDLDTLTRLPRQMDIYGQVFDYCTLVVTDKHMAKARQVLLPTWGLGLVRRADDGELHYRQVRLAKPMRSVRKLTLAQLLWRDEALRALDALGCADGYRSKTRDVLWVRLSEVCAMPELRTIVTDALTARQGWRDVQEPREGAEIPPPGGGSSRFLARRRR